MRNAKSVSMERRHERSIHWKGALYALVVAVFVYAAKMFIVDNPANIFLVYTGVFFVVLGFALSIAEKSMNIPFFNAISNWQGAGVMVNACFLVGLGLGLAFADITGFIFGTAVVVAILVVQRTFMTKE